MKSRRGRRFGKSLLKDIKEFRLTKRRKSVRATRKVDRLDHSDHFQLRVSPTDTTACMITLHMQLTLGMNNTQQLRSYKAAGLGRMIPRREKV